jgi:protein-S-isoprenylcysteine O-methyltransferase Ste14
MYAELFKNLISSPLGIFELISVITISFCVFIILIAVLINFSSSNNEKVKKEKKSLVETGTMFIFFIIYYFVIRFKTGSVYYSNLSIRIPLIIISLIVIIIGTYFNVKGRFILGKNWANQIKIYKNQTLVTKGVYSYVRHPLYASLIWMFYAGAIIYFNWLAFILNSFIFIPFMYYRAKQEEKLLKKEFKNYEKYEKSVGMFFPRLFKKRIKQ